MRVKWKHLVAEGHKTNRYHFQGLEVRILLIGRCDILKDLREAFEVFADSLLMVDETVF